MNTLRWALSLMVFAAMIAACLLQFRYAGMAGLIGGALGFLVRFAYPGQNDMGERLGNGYVGSLSGLFAGFAAVGVGQYVYANYADWLNAIAGVSG
jgi:hypothetical protein